MTVITKDSAATEQNGRRQEIPLPPGGNLRDHFAGQALIANRLAAPDAASSEVAGMAWADADAMLAEREKRDGE